MELQSPEQLIQELDFALHTIFAKADGASRPSPAAELPDDQTNADQKALIGALMRVNHVGEVCAQALYRAQAMTANDDEIREKMLASSDEEVDHLHWCEERLEEIGDRKSLLNPIWYLGSFVIGSIAGMAGDRYNLGFIAETEKQVVRHLEDHLQRLPENDYRSRAIVAQMREDEAEHASKALLHGGKRPPLPIRLGMRMAAKVMTTLAYRI